jgi:transposase-like protein
MKRNRRQFTPKEKVAILRRHFLENVPVSNLCDEYEIHPTIFYRWQKEFFENGEAAFQRQSDSYTRSLEKKNAHLEEKIAYKDGVIAEIVEDHVKLKKSLGEI